MLYNTLTGEGAAKTEGFVKLYRNILDWEWYSDMNTFRVYIHMILSANWQDGRFRGVEIKRGSFVSSYGKLAEATGLSEKNVRTAVKHLEKTGEVACKGYNRFTVFTLKNYDKYQGAGAEGASDGRTTGEQAATIEEVKKERNKELIISKTAAFYLPLNNGSDYVVTNGAVEAWKKKYPTVDIYEQLGRMKTWLDENPARRKAKGGVLRFITSWLDKEAEKKSAKTAKTANKWINYDEREWDFDELERLKRAELESSLKQD